MKTQLLFIIKYSNENLLIKHAVVGPILTSAKAEVMVSLALFVSIDSIALFLALVFVYKQDYAKSNECICVTILSKGRLTLI